MLWKYLKYFTASDPWGDPSRMNGLLLLLLDAIRERWGDAKFIIHCGFEAGGHASDSEHKRGHAVDFHIQSSLSLPEQGALLEKILFELQVFNKVGLGIYPDWNNPGFHLDVRGVFARWGRIDTKGADGKVDQQYVGYGDAVEHAKRKAA